MARRRFFVDQVRNGQAEITGENAQHLSRVLRVEAGQKFEISDNRQVWLAQVETVRKDRVQFQVISEMDTEPEPIPVTLYLSLIKFDRFEWAVEKATELGVTRIVPMDAERSDRGLFEGSHKRVERWRRIARESSEQCRRPHMPVIGDPVRLKEALAHEAAHEGTNRMWFDEVPGAKPLLELFAPGEPAALLIGPEGGWAPSERGLIPAAGWTAASLGSYVLRAETAVCAALAVIAQLTRRYN